MLVQISSGQGPLECQIAVKMLFESLYKEFKHIEKVSEIKSEDLGANKDCYKSITFKTTSAEIEENIKNLEGTIQWICESTIRPNHKRKNWFIDLSVLEEAQDINFENNYKIEFMHCGGKGGQNVNKVETGVRVTHIPTGLTTTCTEERNQLQNKKKAIDKIEKQLKELEKQSKAEQLNNSWKEHYTLERGNPTRVYKGERFKLVK